MSTKNKTPALNGSEVLLTVFNGHKITKREPVNANPASNSSAKIALMRSLI